MLNQIQCTIDAFMNAVQAMDVGNTPLDDTQYKGIITIKTSSDDSKVYIKISDTGKGISSKNLNKIFDPGFTTKNVGVGTGLGLSIVYNIIRKHKGEVKVQSEMGKGTEFNITLPVLQSEK